MPDTGPSSYLCCSAPRLEGHKILFQTEILFIYNFVCVYTYTQTAEGVCSGCEGCQRQLRAATAAPGEEKDNGGREGGQCCPCPKRPCSLGGGPPGGTQMGNAAPPSDASILVFLMPRTAENWGSWIKESRGGRALEGAGAGLVHTKHRWPVTSG